MLKCDLNPQQLEEVQRLFGSINQARKEVQTGIVAHEEYAATVNEINCLSVGDSEYGEALCRQALNYLGLIQAAEAAQLRIIALQEDLGNRYGISARRLLGPRSAPGEVSPCPRATGRF